MREGAEPGLLSRVARRRQLGRLIWSLCRALCGLAAHTHCVSRIGLQHREFRNSKGTESSATGTLTQHQLSCLLLIR